MCNGCGQVRVLLQVMKTSSTTHGNLPQQENFRSMEALIYMHYSGTSIKRTPLGNSLLAVIERWSSLGGSDCMPAMYAL